MKALVIGAAGEPPRLADFVEPVAAPDEQVVEIVAAGIHPVVRKLAAGTHYGSDGQYPLVPGVDAVARLADGSVVYTGMPRAPYGTLAERTVVPKGWAIPLPAGCDPVVAAGTLNPAMAGWLSMVQVGGLQPGGRVLVLGATGVSGRLSVQLALEMGAEVVAVGRNPEALARLMELGVRTVVSVAGEPAEVEERLRAALVESPDVVIDYLWGPVAEAAIAALTRTGLSHHAKRVRWVEVGDMAGPTITLPAAVLRSSGLEFVGSGAGSVDPAIIAAALPEMLDRIAAGAVGVPVRRVSLADAEAAWAGPEEPGVRSVVVPGAV